MKYISEGDNFIMKKLLSIAVASLLITASFAGCGNSESQESTTENNNTPAVESTDAPETEEENTESDESDEDSDEDSEKKENIAEEELDEDIEEIEGEIDGDDAEFDLSEETELTTIVLPEADDSATDDYLGNWECEKIVDAQGETTDVFGVPLYAMMQLSIKDDGTGLLGSGVGTEEENAQPFNWTFEDGQIKLDSGEDDTTPATAFITDGKLAITDDGPYQILYFTKVDEFTEFDWDSFYESMNIGTETENAEEADTDTDVAEEESATEESTEAE